MPSRRTFLNSMSLAAAGLSSGTLLAQDNAADNSGEQPMKKPHPSGREPGSNKVLKVGLIGCGGRGTAAAKQALSADPDVQLVAIGDAFGGPVAGTLGILKAIEEVADQIDVTDERRFIGLDCCQQMLAEVPDLDVVLLATPPFFRPTQYAACIDAGKHVFTEKPVATDVVGIKSTLETSRKAAEKNLCVVSGLCWRYSPGMIDIQQQIADGIIGKPISATSVRYSGVVGRTTPREASKTEFEHQVRNWFFYTWLSGDFIVEQFVHDLDMVAWALGEYPTECIATGGRESRPEEFGNIFDHFAATYTFPSGATFTGTTRHQNGCESQYYNRVTGTRGVADLLKFTAKGHDGSKLYRGKRDTVPMHQAEHDRMFEALREGRRIDNTEYMVQSTLMGILGREAAYTGKILTTEELLASDLSLQPSDISMDATPPPTPVAVPGVTSLQRRS